MTLTLPSTKPVRIILIPVTPLRYHVEKGGGAEDIFSAVFLLLGQPWRFKRKRKKECILREISAYPSIKKTIILRNERDVHRFLLAVSEKCLRISSSNVPLNKYQTYC